MMKSVQLGLAVFATAAHLLLAHYSFAGGNGDAQVCHKKVLLLGDSIGAGFGLAPDQAWASLLAQRLALADVAFVNASISGETSAGGLRRLPDLLENHQPSLLIIELGGNDGLRGYPVKQLRQNLESMIQLGHAANASVYLLGMHIPPNYGPLYARKFHEVFGDLADKHQTAYLPFLLEGVGRKPELMQADGIHPAAEAQPILMDNVLSQYPGLDSCG